MGWEIWFVLAITLLAVFLFASEKLPADVTAGVLMVSLMFSGIITPEEGVSGFSNKATITIAAMFVLSAGLFKTGAVNFAGDVLAMLNKKSYWLGVIAMMLFIGSLSAFINNTAAVAIFLPIVIKAAQDAGLSPSRFLMPMSFASIFGGVCTLIGTSTNILVSSIIQDHGQEPFRMFEFSWLGLIFFGAGLIYMLLIGVRLLPVRTRNKPLTETFELDHYLTDVELLPGSQSVGKHVIDSPLVKNLDLDILTIYRGDEKLALPDKSVVLRPYDVLRVRADMDKVQAIQQREGVRLRSDKHLEDRDIKSAETTLVEVVIAPNSEVEGKTLDEVRFRERFGAHVLAIRQRGELLHEKMATTKLRGGDTLLLDVKRLHIRRLKEDPAFNVVSEQALAEYRTGKVIPALLIIVGVVLTAALDILPIMVSASGGALLMILSGCLNTKEAYRAIEWKVVFLLAGVLPLGIALESSGAAGMLADSLVQAVGAWGPQVFLGVLFGVTVLLTSVMSNNATVVLLAPIAIVAANSMELDPRPFLIAVTFGGSMCFLTPVGYQTNLMVYGPGEYRFGDFFKVGGLLNLLFLILATLLIPLIWPF